METEEKSSIYQPIENPQSNPNIINLRNTPGFLAFIKNIEIYKLIEILNFEKLSKRQQNC